MYFALQALKPGYGLGLCLITFSSLCNGTSTITWRNDTKVTTNKYRR